MNVFISDSLIHVFKLNRSKKVGNNSTLPTVITNARDTPPGVFILLSVVILLNLVCVVLLVLMLRKREWYCRYFFLLFAKTKKFAFYRSTFCFKFTYIPYWNGFPLIFQGNPCYSLNLARHSLSTLRYPLMVTPEYPVYKPMSALNNNLRFPDSPDYPLTFFGAHLLVLNTNCQYLLVWIGMEISL